MDTEQGGPVNGKVYVSFGPRATEEISLEWASGMLTLLKEKHPQQFGKLLAEVIVGGR